MSGAYTSKPSVPWTYPEYPDVPVDWSPGWSWPGASNPPGYSHAPERADILLVSDSTVDAGSETSANTKFVDTTGNGPMGIPSPDFAQIWSATIDGSPILLKKSGGAYASSIEYGYYSFNGYMGASENIQFDISESDAGSTIVLTATSVDGEDTYTDTSSITVNEPPTTNYVDISVSGSDNFGEHGTLTITTTGSSATYDIETETLSAVSGAWTQIGAKYLRIAAEELDPLAIAGAIVSGSFSCSSDSALPTDPSAGVSGQLYRWFGVPYIGESFTYLFEVDLPPHGSGSEDKDVGQFGVDTLTQL